MEHSTGTLSTALLIAAFVLSGCGSPPDRMENAEVSVIEADRDLEIAKSEVEAELQIYKREHADRTAEYNRSIAEIKEKINDESDGEVRARHETRIERYETTHRGLEREMNNYTVSGRESWDDFKDSFSSRMDDLGDSLENFFSTSSTVSSTNQP